MFPFILLVSLAALVMGMLNAKNVFGVPAMASSFFNIGSIVGGVALCYWIEPQADWRHPQFTQRGLAGLAFGTLLGGLLQLLVQVALRRQRGISFSVRLQLARPGRAHHSRADGPGDDRGQRGAGKCGGEHRVRFDVRRRADYLAEHRFSADAIAARSLRRGGRDGHAAARFAQRGARATRGNFAAPSRMPCGWSCCSRFRPPSG